MRLARLLPRLPQPLLISRAQQGNSGGTTTEVGDIGRGASQPDTSRACGSTSVVVRPVTAGDASTRPARHGVPGGRLFMPHLSRQTGSGRMLLVRSRRHRPGWSVGAHGQRTACVPATGRAGRCETPAVSRDIFVQDIPQGISDVAAIPDHWQPQPLPFGQAEVVQAVRALTPDVDAADREWMHVSLPGVDVEVSVGDESPLRSCALHVRATDRVAAAAWVRRLLDRLGARAFDPEAEGGIFRA